MALFRRLLPVLVGAAAGCAATLLAQRYMNEEQEHEHIVGSDAFEDAAEPDFAAPDSDAGDVTAPETDAQPAPEKPVYRPVAADTAPNPNPVRDSVEKAPVTDGKIDVTKVASPEDFGDWDEMGCQG